MRAGVSFGPIDFLGDLPYVAADGSCIVTDPRGNGRYAYALVPTAASTWAFYRIDLYSRAVDLLAAPARAATTVTARARMIFDVTGGALNTPTIWMFAPDTAGGVFFRWQSYSIVTDAWTARNSTLAGMAALAATDTSIAHPCRALGYTDDRYIYVNGDGGAWGGAAPSRMARYDITTDTWAAVTGGGGARAAAPAIGSSLDWLPNLPDFLFSMRGGGSGICDIYSIAGNLWSAIPALDINPGMALDTEGFYTATYFRFPYRLIYSNGGTIGVMDLTNCASGIANPTATTDLIAQIDGLDGTAHQGNCLFPWNVGEKCYVGILPHASKTPQRIRITF